MSIIDLSTYSAIFPFIIGFYSYIKNKLDQITKLFFIVILLGTFSEIINIILWEYKMPNGIVMNFYTLISGILFLILFRKSQTLRVNWYYILLCFYCIGCSFIIFINKDFYILDNDLMIFTNFILMSLASITLIKMTNGDIDNLFSQPLLWISATLLIFSTASNIVYSLFPDSAYDINPQLYEQIWDVHGALNIFCNFLYSYVFICTFKNRFILSS